MTVRDRARVMTLIGSVNGVVFRPGTLLVNAGCFDLQGVGFLMPCCPKVCRLGMEFIHPRL